MLSILLASSASLGDKLIVTGTFHQIDVHDTLPLPAVTAASSGTFSLLMLPLLLSTASCIVECRQLLLRWNDHWRAISSQQDNDCEGNLTRIWGQFVSRNAREEKKTRNTTTTTTATIAESTWVHRYVEMKIISHINLPLRVNLLGCISWFALPH